jgi:lipopolysaccharide transport system permease protein
VLNVIYRDVAYLVNTALLILYWLTPLVYPINVIPYPFRTILQCSPIAGILIAVRAAIMHGQVPSLLGWAGIVGPTALCILAGWQIYRHYEHMVLDYV